MKAFDIMRNHNVTRLCHLTKLKSMIHIITSEGILPSNYISNDIASINDKFRFDGELDYICCSIQYPNTFYLKKIQEKDSDLLFKDWVVLFINLDIINHKKAKFCCCNASKSYGTFINDNMDNIEMVFSNYINCSDRHRPSKLLTQCPTDAQAEILIYNNIPVSYINGIAVPNENVAKRVFIIEQMYNKNIKI